LTRYPVKDDESVKLLLLRVVRRFIELGSNVNAKNNAGETILHSACVMDNPEVVKLLISSGANPMEPNFEGEPCVYTAVRAGNIQIVKLLLDFGIDAHMTANGKSPIDIARQLNDTELVRLLSGETAELSKKQTRTKYKKSVLHSYNEFMEEGESRVSMKFSLSDLEQLKGPSSPRSTTLPGQAIHKSRTAPQIEIGTRKDPHWRATEKKAATPNVRTKISLGSSREVTIKNIKTIN